MKRYAFTVAQICRAHKMSPQAYYQNKRRKRRQEPERDAVLDEVRQVRKRHPKRGARKLYHQLLALLKRLRIGRDKFFALLRANQLLVRRKRRHVATTDSGHAFRVYGNLIKGKKPTRAGEIFQSDITYLRVRDGFAYASLVIDAYSRKIVGYWLHRTLDADGPIKALKQALRQRVGTAGELIHHSDQGVQYCCERYVKLLRAHGVQISMSRKGCPQDNAIAERVNGILKDEYALADRFSSFFEAKQALKEAVWLYNHERPHLSLAYKTPQQVHLQHLKLAA